MNEARTLRQRLVAEIGEQGQARIASASASASTELEARYLAFAGFREVHAPSGGQGSGTFVEASFAESDPAVRELATSAARALVQIKAAAGIEGASNR
jgi:hypothetical protein